MSLASRRKGVARVGILCVAGFLPLVALAGGAAAYTRSPTAVVLERWLVELEEAGRIRVASETISRSPELFQVYSRRGFEPIWTGRGSAEELVSAIRSAEEHGLDPRDYHLDAILSRTRVSADAVTETAARDLVMTDALVQLVRDVQQGRASPDRHVEDDLVPASFGDGNDAGGNATVAGIEHAIARGRITDHLRDVEPQAAPYQRLKSALASYREIHAAGGWRTIPPGAALKPGAHDPRMNALRERLTATGDLPKSWLMQKSDVYDKALAEGVRAFQARHGLDADGALGAKTLAAMNVPVEARIEQIRASLERARWFLQDLPDRYVMVNAAAFRVMFVENDEVIWSSRVIVGEPDKETPMFRSAMQSIVLNPSWSVPDSIVKNEFLPALRKDPRYLARKGITRVGDDYVQPPGRNNALGRIKMLLPNPYSVYLHDTPTRSLFNRTTRTLSHGCVRVEKPVELAALALDDPKWSAGALERAISTGKTRTIPVSNPVPVFVLYSSVTAHRDGTVEFLPDVYERDDEVLRALRSPPVEKKRAASA